MQTVEALTTKLEAWNRSDPLMGREMWLEGIQRIVRENVDSVCTTCLREPYECVNLEDEAECEKRQEEIFRERESRSTDWELGKAIFVNHTVR